MTDHLADQPFAGGHQAHHRRIGATVAAVAVTSVVALVWTLSPERYPFGRADRVTVSVTHLFQHTTAAMVLLASAVLGVLVLAGSVAATSASARRAITVAAAAEAIFFALVMADASVMSVLGYALAFSGPVLVVTVIVAACLRRNTAGYAAAAAGLLLIGAGLSRIEVVGRFWRNVSHGVASYGVRIGWALLMAALAAVWVWITVGLMRSGGATRPAALRRWARPVTIAAAVCPLPYAVLRLLWLTPWALDLREDMDVAEVRMQGAFLGMAALLGSALTLGLISRWGEVFPRWVPVVGGRPVPPALAVVPGGVVAAAAAMAGPGLLVSSIESNGDGRGISGVVLALAIFPFPIWGPLLGAAVVAYHLRRRIAATPAGRC
jgi:hypothetical protein